MPRTERLEIRLSPEEKEAFELAAKRHGLTVSDYLRACGHQDVFAEMPPELVKRLVQMNAQTIGKKSETFPGANASPSTNPPTAAPTTTPGSSSSNKSMTALPAIFVDSVNIKNASLTYIDKSFTPELHTAVDQLNVDVSRFSLNHPFSFVVSGRALSARAARNASSLGSARLLATLASRELP